MFWGLGFATPNSSFNFAFVLEPNPFRHQALDVAVVAAPNSVRTFGVKKIMVPGTA